MADQQSRGGKKTGGDNGHSTQQQGVHNDPSDRSRSENHKREDAQAGAAGRGQRRDNHDDPSRAPESGTRE